MQLIYQSRGHFGSTICYKILQHFHYSDLWPNSSPEPGRCDGPAARRGAQAPDPPPKADGQRPETRSRRPSRGRAFLCSRFARSAGSPSARPAAPGLPPTPFPVGAPALAALPARLAEEDTSPSAAVPSLARPPQALSGQGRREGAGPGGRDYSSRRATLRSPPSRRPA